MPTAFQEEILRAIQKGDAEAGAHDWEIVRHINYERVKAAMSAHLASKHVSDELRNMEKQGLVTRTPEGTWKAVPSAAGAKAGK